MTDLDVRPSTMDEAKLFQKPVYIHGNLGHTPAPHPWADMFSALTTGLGMAGGMIAAPALAGAAGLDAATAATAEGANWIGRTALPFLTRMAWRVPVAGAGAAAGAMAGREAAHPMGGPPPSLSQALPAAQQGVENELGAHAIQGGMNVVGAAIPHATDLAEGLLNRLPAPVRKVVGGTVSRVATAIQRPFAAAATKFQQDTFGGPPIPGVEPTPAQTHPGMIRGIAEGLGRLSMVSKRFAEADARNSSVISQAADDLVRQFGPKATPEEAGAVVRTAKAKALGGPPPAPTLPNAPTYTPPETSPDLTAAQGRAVIAGGQARTAAEHVNDITTALRSNAGPRVGQEATGTIFKASAAAAEQAAREVSRDLYQTVDHLAGGAVVSLDPVSAAAQDVVKGRGLALDLQGGKLKSTVKTLAEAGPGEAPPTPTGVAAAQAALTRGTITQGGKEVAVPPDHPVMMGLRQALEGAKVSPEDLADGHITFGQAQEVSSELGKQAYTASQSAEAHAAQTERALLQIKSSLESSMETSAGGKDSPLYQAYRAATDHYRDTVSAYNRGILSQALTKEPRLVSRALLQPGRVAEITDLWSRVSPEAKQAVQGQWMHDLLDRSPEGVVKELQKWTEPTLGAIFDKATTSQLTDLQGSIGQAADRADEFGAAQKALGTASSAQGKAITAAEGAFGKATAAHQAEVERLGSAFQRDTEAHAAAVGKVLESPAIEAFGKALPRGDAETTLKMRRLVGETDWPKVQSAGMQAMLYDDAGHLRDAKALGNLLGPDALPALDVAYGQNGRQALQSLQRSIAITGAPKRTGGWGALAMSLGQVGAMFTLMKVAAGQDPISAGAEAGLTLLAPAMVAKIMTNPSARAWLTTGLEAQRAGDVTRWTRMGAYLANWMRQSGLIPGLGGPPPRGRVGVGQPPPPMTPGIGGRAGGPPPPSVGGGR